VGLDFVTANFSELRKGEVRRITIPRTPLNRAKKKGRSCYAPAQEPLGRLRIEEVVIDYDVLVLLKGSTVS
jgi:hypothetical protein